MKICVATDVHRADDQRINKEIKSLKKIADVVFISPRGKPAVEVSHVEIDKPDSRIVRFLKSPKQIYREVLRIKPDFFHFHDPELIPIGVRLSRKGIKVVYDVHENYPAVILTKSYIPRWLRKIVSVIFEKYENSAVKRFYGVVVVTENMCERFSKYTRCVMVPNYPDIDMFRGIDKAKRNDGKVRFVYVGSIDEDRAIFEMVEAFKLLRSERNDVELQLVGPIYSSKLRNYLNSCNIGGFTYHPPVPHRKALEMISHSDVGMLVIHRNRSKEISSPVKMFEYLFYDLPIVASNFEYWKKILNERCAVFVEPEDINSIYEGMKKAIDMIGKTNCQEIVKKYSWEVCERELLKIYG